MWTAFTHSKILHKEDYQKKKNDFHIYNLTFIHAIRHLLIYSLTILLICVLTAAVKSSLVGEDMFRVIVFRHNIHFQSATSKFRYFLRLCTSFTSAKFLPD